MTETSTTDRRTTDRRTADARAAETAELPVVTASPDPSVTVNGIPRSWEQHLTVADVVLDLLGDAPGTTAGCDAGTTPAACATGTATAPTGVAAALDDTIVPRGLWASTPVPAGARVEVVTAVQGG